MDNDLKVILAALVFFTIALAALQPAAPFDGFSPRTWEWGFQPEATGIPRFTEDPEADDDLDATSRAIFEKWALPFEVLSLLLLAALIAAVFMAKREADA